MEKEFAIANVVPGKLNALVKNIMRQTKTDDPEEAVRLVNSGEWIISRPVRTWREENGIIYLSVISDGTTGSEWIKRLEKAGKTVTNYAKSILNSPDFKPTKGVTYEIAVMKGLLWNDNDRLTKNIRAKAGEMKFTTPNAEIACLIREKYSDKDLEAMGLYWVVAMHEPIKDSDGIPFLLSADRDDDGDMLSAGWDEPDNRWYREGGFAFCVSQVSAQK